MDSEHNSSSCEDSDCEICQTMGSSLEDSTSLTEENVQGISNNEGGSEPNHGNEPNLSQNFQSLSNQPLATKFSSLQNYHQTGEISNTLPSSQHLSYQSSENKSNMFQDKEITFSGSKSGHLQHYDTPGTEFSAIENKVPHCKKSSSKVDHLHSLSLEASEIVPSVNRQLFTKRQQFSNRCHAIHETQVQTKLRELNVNQDLGPSSQQFAESNMNRIQILDSACQQQSRNVQIMSQTSHPVSHQSTVNQSSCKVLQCNFGNEFRDNRLPNIGCLQYSPGTSGIQNLHLPSLQQSNDVVFQHHSGFNYIQSSHPQQHPQYEIREFHIQTQSQRLPAYESREYTDFSIQQSESDTKAIKAYSKIDSIRDEKHSPMNLVSKESILNQDLCSQQPAESRTQGFHKVPQVFKVNSSTERHYPYSLSQQQSKQMSRVVQSAEKATGASQDNMPQQDYYSRRRLLGRFLDMCVDQNRPTSQAQAPQHFDLSMLQHPYSNRSETMNLLVFGPTSWTSRLIQTYSRELQLCFASPYNHVFTKNVTRCGIVTSVSVFQVEDLMKSVTFMKSCCLSTKATIMFVFDVADQCVETFIEIVRRRVSRNVPITFVGCKHNVAGNKVLRLFKAGHKLKAKYDLSAFLVCRADSEEEVDAVIYNAMDVSRYITI